MSTPQTIEHKIGATFAYSGTIELPEGTWSAACQARNSAGLVVQDFDVTLTPPVDPATASAITIRAESTDTDTWTAGDLLKCDVVFIDTSIPPNKVPTHTFVIKVLAKVTDA